VKCGAGFVLWSERPAPRLLSLGSGQFYSPGADAVLVVSPFYWKVGEEGLVRHFATVAELVDIPVVVYNLPMLICIDLSPSLIGGIAAECPNMSGLKDTVTEYFHSLGVLQEVKAARPEFSVLMR
jgi:dihydrodipicolinate synthase/N-acetylneuraminate lyase